MIRARRILPVLLVFLLACGASVSAFARDYSFWCPRCNDHHEMGHPHGRGDYGDPPPGNEDLDFTPVDPRQVKADGLVREGNALLETFDRSGRIGDLRSAKAKLEEALQLRPGHEEGKRLLLITKRAIRDEQNRLNRELLLKRLAEANALRDSFAQDLSSLGTRTGSILLQKQEKSRIEENLELLGRKLHTSVPSGSRIGMVGGIEGEVYAVGPKPDAKPRRLSSGSNILQGDRIVTGKNGRMQVFLLDETVFTMGPDSDMVMDEFVYDPFTDEGKIASEIMRGLFRFVTGNVGRKRPVNIRIKLPTFAVGIRGTQFILEVDPEKESKIAVLEGTVWCRPDRGGRTLDIEAGQYLVVAADGSPGPVRSYADDSVLPANETPIDPASGGVMQRLRTHRFLVPAALLLSACCLVFIAIRSGRKRTFFKGGQKVQ